MKGSWTGVYEEGGSSGCRTGLPSALFLCVLLHDPLGRRLSWAWPSPTCLCVRITTGLWKHRCLGPRPQMPFTGPRRDLGLCICNTACPPGPAPMLGTPSYPRSKGAGPFEGKGSVGHFWPSCSGFLPLVLQGP